MLNNNLGEIINYIIKFSMDSSSPQFGEERRRSYSPVPLRSPSPDIVTRSTIISTTSPANILTHNTSQENTPLKQQFMLLKAENRRLKKIIEQGGGREYHTKLEEKERVVESKLLELRAMALENERLHRLLESSKESTLRELVTLQQTNTELKKEVLSLTVYKSEYYKLQSSIGDTQPYIPQPNVESRSLSREIEEIKQHLQSTLQKHINDLNSHYNSRLNNVERKLLLIEDSIYKLNEAVTSRTRVEKKPNNTHGDSTSIGTPTPSNTINQEHEYQRQIGELRGEIQRLKRSELTLQSALKDLDDQNMEKQDRIKEILSTVSRENKDGSSAEWQRYRRELDGENQKLKLSISSLSSQIIQLKNQRTYLTKQLEITKRTVENEREQSTIQIREVELKEEKKSQNLRNEIKSLNETLSHLRGIYNDTQNEIEGQIRENKELRLRVERTEKEKNEVMRRSKENSDVKIQTETDQLRLRLQINELEKRVFDADSQLSQKQGQLSLYQGVIGELKNQLSGYEADNGLLQREVMENQRLSQENEILSRKVVEYERSIEEVMKGSDHTKNEFIRIGKEKQELEREVIGMRYKLEEGERNLVGVSNQLGGLEQEYQRLKEELIREREENSHLNIIVGERDHLAQENQRLIHRQTQFEFERGRLIQEIQLRDRRIRELSTHSIIDHQRHQGLESARSELISVKKLLEQLNLESVEHVIAELHSRETIIEEYKEQSINFKSKVLEDMEKLRKENLEAKHIIIGMEESVQHLKTLIAQLESEIKIVNEKNARLDQTIRSYVSQPTDPVTITSQVTKQVKKLNETRTTIQEVNKLRIPLQFSVSKLDEVIHKIEGINSLRETHVIETHSEIISNFDLQQSGASRRE